MANLGAKETAWCFLEAEGLKRPEGVQRHQQREKGPWGGGGGGEDQRWQLRELQPRAHIYQEQYSRGSLRRILKTGTFAS